MSISLLLVDDHAVVRQGLRMLLAARDDMVIVGEAERGDEAVELARTLRPSVVLMDMLLPGLDGIEATRQIKAAGLPCAVLMLTSSVQPQQIQAAIRAGALGYLVKAAHAHEVIAAIRRAAAGQRVLDPLAAETLMSDMASPDDLDDLTPREREVLRALALGRSNAQIANALTISEATVRSHVANLLGKLNLRDRAHATIFALKRGLVTLEEIE
ncbi:MAG: response regulator transcription factor [Chloroflexaceae bacterium]|nr:response regulator transcription factor [Chloroflexaceae bacterium]